MLVKSRSKRTGVMYNTGIKNIVRFLFFYEKLVTFPKVVPQIFQKLTKNDHNYTIIIIGNLATFPSLLVVIILRKLRIII